MKRKSKDTENKFETFDQINETKNLLVENVEEITEVMVNNLPLNNRKAANIYCLGLEEGNAKE